MIYNPFLQRPAKTGFDRHHRLGFTAENSSTDLPTAVGSTTFTDPAYEIDFSTLDCKTLQTMQANLAAFLQAARLTVAAAAYYNIKLAAIKAAFLVCSNSTSAPVTTPITTPVTTVLIPVTPIGDTPSGTTYYAGADPGIASSSGGDAGASASAPATTKSTFDWWWLVAALLVGYTAYKTNKAA